MYYPRAMFGDDTSGRFSVRMLVYTTMHTPNYRAANSPTHAGDYVETFSDI